MGFPVDLTDILPLKNNAEIRKPFVFRNASVEVVISRDGFGRYGLWVYGKDKKGNDGKRFGQDNLSDEQATESIWKLFLEEPSSIFE
jgi:hypothetical protein